MDTPTRLVELSVERDTPLDLLAALRQVASNVELVHVGDARWWLGLVRPNPSQHAVTAPMGEAPWSTTRERKVHLQRQGFRFLGEYTDEQLSASYLTEELNFMLNRSEKEVEADFWKAVDKADYSQRHEEEIVRTIMDKIDADKRSIWAKAARQRITVGVNGLRGT